jgi:putative transposase
VRYAWVEQNGGSYPIEALCEAPGVSPSGSACWKCGGGRQMRLSDAQLLDLIRAIYVESRGAYGLPRVFRELKARGVAVSRERVARLTRKNDIRARHKRRYKATTDSRHDCPVAPDLRDRNFEPNCPDQTWTADITFIPMAEGWLYLAVVMDLYTRMVVGWAMDARMTRELVINALRMAYFRRRPKPGLMHHSDRGSQYCSADYQALLHQYGMLASMSRKGNCWDNAPTESFFRGLKNERTHTQRYATRDEARRDTFEYIEVFYNRSRRHSALGDVSLAQYYAAWQNQQKLAA